MTNEPAMSRQGSSGRDYPREIELVVVELRGIADAVRDLSDQVPPDPLRLLRAEDVAELLKIPARTVRDQAAAGVIPHRRLGKHYRFSRADVEQLIGDMRRSARPNRSRFQAA